MRMKSLPTNTASFFMKFVLAYFVIAMNWKPGGMLNFCCGTTHLKSLQPETKTGKLSCADVFLGQHWTDIFTIMTSVFDGVLRDRFGLTASTTRPWEKREDSIARINFVYKYGLYRLMLKATSLMHTSKRNCSIHFVINDIHLREDTNHANAIFKTGPRATRCLLSPCWWPVSYNDITLVQTTTYAYESQISSSMFLTIANF